MSQANSLLVKSYAEYQCSAGFVIVWASGGWREKDCWLLKAECGSELRGGLRADGADLNLAKNQTLAEHVLFYLPNFRTVFLSTNMKSLASWRNSHKQAQCRVPACILVAEVGLFPLRSTKQTPDLPELGGFALARAFRGPNSLSARDCSLHEFYTTATMRRWEKSGGLCVMKWRGPAWVWSGPFNNFPWDISCSRCQLLQLTWWMPGILNVESCSALGELVTFLAFLVFSDSMFWTRQFLVDASIIPEMCAWRCNVPPLPQHPTSDRSRSRFATRFFAALPAIQSSSCAFALSHFRWSVGLFDLSLLGVEVCDASTGPERKDDREDASERVCCFGMLLRGAVVGWKACSG